MANDKPIDVVHDRAIKGSIWRNESEKGTYYTVTLSKTYKTNEGEYRDTHSIHENDFLRGAEVLRKAHERVINIRREAALAKGPEIEPKRQPDRGRDR